MTPTQFRTSSTRVRRTGYVLVMVLALLVIAATLLVAVSRAAGRSAMAARSAEEQLQRRWGLVSVRRAVLPHVERALGAVEQERRRPMPSYSVAVRLGAVTFDLTLADEQAKANVNAVLEGSDVTRAEARLRQGLSGSGLGNRIKLRPSVGPVAVRLVAPGEGAAPTTAPVVTGNGLTVGAWGQVFDAVPPAQLMRPVAGSRGAALESLTLWGTGAVNVRRATDTALTLAGGRSITTVDVNRLIDARDKLFETRPGAGSQDESPTEKLKALIMRTIGESLKNNGNLGLTERSTCHSLWVVTRTGRRDGYDLFVEDTSDDKRPMTWAYTWE